ncbi:MAG: hypothetical protein NXH95_15935 [Pseudomonadaceae bacterium]|nr:hypothetical protein [Pseudomonadaceae bacterium]
MGSYDSIISKAIGGLKIDGELYDLRARHDSELAAQQEKLFAKKHDAEEFARAARSSSLALTDTYSGFDTSVAALRGAFDDHAVLIERLDCEVEAYRMRHGLTSEPAQISPVEGAMAIGFITMLESVLNAGFFMTAHLSAGPIAALLTSTLISVTNMSVSVAGGYFAGRGWNYGAHAPDADDAEFVKVRKASRIGSAITWAALGLFHLSVGCVRAQETFDVTHGISEYLDVLATPESLFLVLIGLVMSAFGWHKGRTALGEKYLGYGERARALSAAKEAIYDELDAGCYEIERLETEALETLDDTKDEITSTVTASNQAVHEYMAEDRAMRRAIQNAHSAMTVGIAQICSTHQMGRKGKTKNRELPTETLRGLTDFDAYLPGNPPAYFDAPDLSRAQISISEAKSRAMESLSEAFNRARNAARGDDK